MNDKPKYRVTDLTGNFEPVDFYSDQQLIEWADDFEPVIYLTSIKQAIQSLREQDFTDQML